jgi:hypothetical protein
MIFGCDRVQDALFELATLTPDALARTAPVAARHLGWCHACRSRLAELRAVERELGAPRWSLVARAGERVREAAGRLVVQVGRTIAGLAQVPDGFAVLAPAVAVAPVRGPAADPSAPVPLLARSTRFALGDSGAAVELGIEPAGDARATVTIAIATPSTESLSLRLLEVRPDGEALVARHTVRGAEPVVMRELWPASFIVELHEPHGGERYRVRLDVGPGV